MTHVSESDRSVELKQLEGLKLGAEMLFFPHCCPIFGQSASVWTCDLSCSTCCNSFCGYLCTELLSFQCTEQLTWWGIPNKWCLPTHTAGLERRSVLRRQSLKINLLRKLYYGYQRCTHTHTLDRASILQWKMGLKYSLDSITMSFFLLRSALDCGV